MIQKGAPTMTSDELQQFARKRPLDPFRVILTTGATYDIRHPELFMVGHRSVVIGMTKDPEGTRYDTALTVDLRHVVAVQELPVSPPSIGSQAG
jgi:hypothetical protein